MARATARPEKVIGMHFFYPAHVMKLVEVIPGSKTSEDTIQTVMIFAESLRKIPVKVGECAGFLVNRLLMPYLNEAAFCLQEGGASVQEMDSEMVRFGMPMGPFTLVDNLGVDVCYDVVQILLNAYGDRMKPAEIWQELYGMKRFGKKNGVGFYNYSGDNNDDTVSRLIRVIQDKLRVGACLKPAPTSIPTRLLFSMVNEAILCVEEKIANAWDIDIAMLAGVGFPQTTEGLLHYADSVGLDVILDQLKKFQQEHGIRFKPAPLLEKMVA
jgi:3-hydroxyacyl-CoA dehydrogenase/enoyl-CoA hydratase/3-hydroxybutyryl-CoA epimerase